MDPALSHQALGRGEAFNPILAGMYPDPSITRVGQDFYLVNSTFAWYPGVPIFHSRDLIHWQQLGFVLNRPSQLKLDGMQVSRGVFAPTIRFHNGTFYMITTLVDGIGNFYVTATNPTGPWSDPVALPEINGIDPSFFFDDDGKAYIVHNGPPPDNKPLYDGHRAIWVFPFDMATGKVSGRGHIIVNGGVDITKKPSWIEGPHLLRHDGFYYLIAAEGGTSVAHSEVVFRSRSLEGPFVPYQQNPILTQRDLDPTRANPVADTGHADFVEDTTGQWWSVFLGVQPYQANLFNNGRETFLLPVSWKDGWPTILPPNQSVPRKIHAAAALRTAKESLGLSGNFAWNDDFQESTLRPEWQMLRTPSETWWSLTSHPGSLSLEARPDDLVGRGNPSFLGRRQQHEDFSTSIAIQLATIAADADAGLVALQNEHAYYFFGVSSHARAAGKTQEIFLEMGTGSEASPKELRLNTAPLPADARHIQLRMTGSGGRISFSYRVDSGNWQEFLNDVDATNLSTDKAGGFVGTFLGPFARTHME